MSSSHIPTSLEWQDILPLDFHNYAERGVVTVSRVSRELSKSQLRHLFVK